MIIVNGGTGFIGTNFVLDWLEASQEPIFNLYKLTCAGNFEYQRGVSSAWPVDRRNHGTRIRMVGYDTDDSLLYTAHYVATYERR